MACRCVLAAGEELLNVDEKAPVVDKEVLVADDNVLLALGHTLAPDRRTSRQLLQLALAQLWQHATPAMPNLCCTWLLQLSLE